MKAAKEVKYFLIRRLLTYPAYKFLSLYANTIRVTTDGDEPFLQHLKDGGRVLFACWHQRFFGGFYFPGIYSLEPCIMISQSRDGDFIAAVVQKMGWRPVRGSSTRGGRQALLQMIQGLEEHAVGAHIVDGPQGPPRVIKPGLLSIALRSGAAVCPAYVSYQNPWIFNSWDRFMIAKPFSRVHIHFSGLIAVPEDIGEEDFEVLRRRIEDEMIEGHKEADRRWEK
jgi:lysophospholipid acyltransferase (LPLAT)-like uncharacterized protein